MALISSRTMQGRCPACGAEHAACGTPSDAVPVDQNVEVAAVGGPLEKYTVTMPNGVETVMKLNAADAERLGGVPVDAPAEEPAEGPAEGPAEEPQAKKKAVPNKARTAIRKGSGGDG
jgi:hypothetical protein